VGPGETSEEPLETETVAEERDQQVIAEPRKSGEIVDLTAHEDEEESPVSSRQAVPASPAVRRFAREIGVDIAQVPTSGSKGRISVDDVKRFAKQLQGAEIPRKAASFPDFSLFGNVERVPFNKIRSVTASRLSTAWANVAHVTQHDRADVTNLEPLRKQYSSKVEAAGGKLTVTAIALKIVAAALKIFPKFNGSIDVDNQEVVLKSYYNIGVAVDTERGLIVPVIRHVDQKNIVQLSVELKEIAERTREGKISLDELQGGTFTVTNLGGIGGTAFTPIVNFPEVAILGISRTSIEPVFIEGAFQPRQMLPLSLSYDHRLIDGAEAARFLRWVAEAFTEPFLLALEG
jgi:pyruvate dehydrogenase E2 component (dihydrolipoamide acetyltransferase)